MHRLEGAVEEHNQHLSDGRRNDACCDSTPAVKLSLFYENLHSGELRLYFAWCDSRTEQRFSDFLSDAELLPEVLRMRAGLLAILMAWRRCREEVNAFNDKFIALYGYPPSRKHRRAFGREVFERYHKVSLMVW